MCTLHCLDLFILRHYSELVQGFIFFPVLLPVAVRNSFYNKKMEGPASPISAPGGASKELCCSLPCSDNCVWEGEALCLKQAEQPKQTPSFPHLPWLRRAALHHQLCHCHVVLEAAGVSNSSTRRGDTSGCVSSGSYKPSLRF